MTNNLLLGFHHIRVALHLGGELLYQLRAMIAISNRIRLEIQDLSTDCSHKSRRAGIFTRTLIDSHASWPIDLPLSGGCLFRGDDARMVFEENKNMEKNIGNKTTQNRDNHED